MNKMSNLEYRLNEEEKDYPAIYHYDQLERNEIYCRRMCDYFIKDGKVFRKTSCSREQEMFVIFVEEDTEEELFDNALTYSHVTLEIRDYHEEESPLLYTYELETHENALEFLGNDYIQIGDCEYEKIAAEIDEDRSTYVLYAASTGYIFS